MKTDNELIAFFMDGITFDESGLCTDPEQKYSWRPGCYDPLRVENLQYHNNWSWLMPVVEKINNIDISEFNYNATAMSKMRFLQEKLQQFSITTPMRIIYPVVVEICKWYNQQNQ
jgi:hypothetical protein